MKKLCFVAITAIAVLLAACSTDDPPTVDGYGSLLLTSNVNTQTNNKSTRATPTDSYSTYFLKLEGPTPMTIPYPADGTVSDLATGEYTVSMFSHESMPAPAFDVQYYAGSKNVTVTPDETVPLALTLYQANAGLYFVYDESLEEADLEDIELTVAHADGTLVYSGENRDAWGYYAPGEVTISAKSNGTVVPIEGQDTYTHTMAAREVWEVKIGSTAPGIGGISLTITVEEITNATNNLTLNVGEGGGGEGGDITLELFQGEYSFAGTTANFSSTAGRTSWTDTFTLIDEEGYRYIHAAWFDAQTINHFYDWEEDAKTLRMDTSTRVAQGTNQGVTYIGYMTFCYLYKGTDDKNYIAFYEEGDDIELATVNAQGGVSYDLPIIQNPAGTQSQVFLAIPGFNSSTGAYAVTFSDGYSKLNYTKTGATAGFTSYENHVEKSEVISRSTFAPSNVELAPGQLEKIQRRLQK